MLFNLLKRSLEVVSLAILITLAVVVVVAVIFRYSGQSLVWYDEIASVLLAWLTYFGAALAALNRSHLGFTGVIESLPRNLRVVLFIVADATVVIFAGLCAYGGAYVLQIFGNETLVSLPIPLAVTQSIIPIGFGLFALAHLASAPRAFRELMDGPEFKVEESAV